MPFPCGTVAWMPWMICMVYSFLVTTLTVALLTLFPAAFCRAQGSTFAIPPAQQPGGSATAGASSRPLEAVVGPPRPVVGPPAPADRIGPPPLLYGPPTPADREVVKNQARCLMEALRAGRLTFTNRERDTEQLCRLEQAGCYTWPSPPPARASLLSRRAPQTLRSTPIPSANGRPTDDTAPPPARPLLQMLIALTAHSTPQRPLEILSFLRPPYKTATWRHGGLHDPHALGVAADIGAYGGHRVLSAHPEACVAATLALLRDLPPGRYRLGLPKAPEDPLTVGLPPLPALLTEPLTALLAADNKLSANNEPSAANRRSADPAEPRSAQAAGHKRAPPTVPAAPVPPVAFTLGVLAGKDIFLPRPAWPFFPAPEPELVHGVVAPLRVNGQIVLDAQGRPQPHFVRFRNENYAPEEALGDARLQKALQAARQRGVNVVALFPDAPDHIHIDVRSR